MKLVDSSYEVLTRNKTAQSAFTLVDENLFIGMYRKHIYVDPARVVPQEYLCNARDAHREVSQSKRIRVTLPNGLDPRLVIRDYGPGIDDERIKIFTRYGDSTKRSDDDQTGGWGIGCKCAWSYTDSFTMSTVFINSDSKRVKKKYHLYVTGDNCPGICRLVSERETEDDLGTEIVIPIKNNDIRKINSSVRDTVAYWNEDELPIINGEESYSNILGEDHGRFWSLKDGDHRFSVVVDGINYQLNGKLLEEGITEYQIHDGKAEEVCYKLSEEYIKILRSNMPLLKLKFATGEMDISPNRTDLSYTPKTITAIQNAMEAVRSFICDIVVHITKNSDSLLDFIRCLAKHRLRDTIISFDNEIDQSKYGLDITISELWRSLGWCYCVRTGIRKYTPLPLMVDNEKVGIYCYNTPKAASSAASRLKRAGGATILGYDTVLIFSNINRVLLAIRTAKKLSLSGIDREISEHKIRGVYCNYFGYVPPQELVKSDSKIVYINMSNYNNLTDDFDKRWRIKSVQEAFNNPVIKDIFRKMNVKILFVNAVGLRNLKKLGIDIYHISEVAETLKEALDKSYNRKHAYIHGISDDALDLIVNECKCTRLQRAARYLQLVVSQPNNRALNRIYEIFGWDKPRQVVKQDLVTEFTDRLEKELPVIGMSTEILTVYLAGYNQLLKHEG